MYALPEHSGAESDSQQKKKKQLEQLLDGEHFEPIEFEDDAMKKYLEIYQSQNWMLIGGKLISKKLALWVTVDRSKNDTLLKILYLNGTTAKAKSGSGDKRKKI